MSDTFIPHSFDKIESENTVDLFKEQLKPKNGAKVKILESNSQSQASSVTASH